MKNWKLELKSGDIISYSSPCPPFKSITDVVQRVYHYSGERFLRIKFQHQNEEIVTGYDYIEHPRLLGDLADDYEAFINHGKD